MLVILFNILNFTKESTQSIVVTTVENQWTFTRVLKKALQFFWRAIVIMLITLIVLEISYRYYWIDFYKTEFNALNKNHPINPSKGTFLLFGDSFSAQEISYSRLLQDSSNINLINLSIPGSCALQHELYAAKKIKEYKPNAVIFQVYVGNDLLDISHPLNWGKVSFTRNVYWLLRDQFTVIGYLNYRIAQLDAVKIETNKLPAPIQEKTFSTSLYDSKTKLHILADNNFGEKSAFLLEGKNEQFKKLIQAYQQIVEGIDDNTKIYFLVIPDVVQASEYARNNYQSIGMTFTNTSTLSTIDYPFYHELVKSFPTANFINPLGSFIEEEKKGNRMYFENDPHLNQKGQQLIYNLIKSKIETN